MEQRREVHWSVSISALLMAALFLMPLTVVRPFSTGLFSGEKTADETAEEQRDDSRADAETVLRVLDGDTVLEMELGTYLEGVVRAEMPASFHPEALKAQAVAARTYTLYKIQKGGSHGETADICTDPGCCQAYCSEEAAGENWGAETEQYRQKVEEAVRETDGQVILYGGEPILAVFHSSSAGRTRAAGNVWLSDVPYLQAVESPEDSSAIPNYYSRVEIAAAEFRENFLAAHPDAALSGDADGWLWDAVTDAAGSVETICVGGVFVKGSELRSILGLRSACFTWEAQAEKLVFYVTGYGHGVGLSQYGANAMAEEGADYAEILTHYYTGVTVGPWG